VRTSSHNSAGILRRDLGTNKLCESCRRFENVVLNDEKAMISNLAAQFHAWSATRAGSVSE
jgi:hypothetical protein